MANEHLPIEAQDRIEALKGRVIELESVLTALMTNPHLNLGDLIYTVRERECVGWDGPAVIAWGNAVEAAEKATKR